VIIARREDDMHNPLVHFGEDLCRAGHLSVPSTSLTRKGQRRRTPESWSRPGRGLRVSQGHPQFGTSRIVAAGKSMGGRIASQMTADGLLPAKALVFLGYPLHPPGKKDQLRDAHLYHISVPMLFFAGTRDALCDMDRLRNVLNRLQTPWELETIEGGDHSFVLPKSFKTSEVDVYERILQRTAAWLKQTV
jgi:predicted alpha/beta-hydrolase family hydrolase